MDPSPKVKEIKAKLNKWYLLKLKSLCTAKETSVKWKDNLLNGRKIFANDMTDKGFISNI